MFKKYIHLERLGSQEVDGIECGVCHVFPKIDGTNASVWFDNGEKTGYPGLQFGSRSRVLEDGHDNHAFRNTMLKDAEQAEKLVKVFEKHPDWNIYGEWLVPHTLKSYRESAWRKFWIFDVLDGDDKFLTYEEYFPELEGLNVIDPLAVVDSPSQDQLMKIMKYNNTFLIEDGKGIGEGIVIKRYGYKNKYDRIAWAKLVNHEFKELNQRAFERKIQPGEMIVERAIVQDFVTEAFVRKELAKIQGETQSRGQIIPRLLHTVYYELIRENAWEMIKKYNRPTINYAILYKYCVERTKQHVQELFQ